MVRNLAAETVAVKRIYVFVCLFAYFTMTHGKIDILHRNAGSSVRLFRSMYHISILKSFMK